MKVLAQYQKFLPMFHGNWSKCLAYLKKEKIQYEEDGLWLIARAAAGSIRDAQSIMDQAISFSAGKISAEEVTNLLGLIPRNALFAYAEFIITFQIVGGMAPKNGMNCSVFRV